MVGSPPIFEKIQIMAAPIKNTCPDIDKYIKWIKAALVKERDLSRMNEKDVFDSAVSMSNELEECIGYLENMRTSNGELRDWGTGLEEELHQAATEISNLEDKVAELEQKIEEYERQLTR